LLGEEFTVSEMMRAFSAWVENDHVDDRGSFRGYAFGISQARYVIRKALRIVDEQAKKVGLDPLQHQALIQIYGSSADRMPVNKVAERLDIAPAFASRLIKELEGKGLIRREHLPEDKRVTWVAATDAGIQLLRDIDDAVHIHVNYFQSQLTDEERMAALAIFAFYVGLEGDSDLADAIRMSLGNLGKKKSSHVVS
jgi:DNA-binding MarR family transcriptional regulator